MHRLIEFFSNHIVLVALIASAAWFFAGRQYVAEGKLLLGLSWQGIGVVLLAVYSVKAALSRDWLNLIVAIAASAVELYLMRRVWLEHSLEPTPPSA